MKVFKPSLGLIFLVSFCGCDSPADRLFKEQVQLRNEVADRMEQGTFDAITAQDISARTMANLHKQEKLKIPPEERKRLEEKYKAEMDKAQARVERAMQKMPGKRLTRLRNGSGSEAPKPPENGKDSAEDSKISK